MIAPAHPASSLSLMGGVLALLIAPTDSRADHQFNVGVEGFRDHYEEPSVTVDTHTGYRSIMAGYEHDHNDFFSAIDARYSWGKNDYKSVSGALNGTPETETDLRLRTGFSVAMEHGLVMPYIGLGWRYYFMEGKGLATNLGALSYDRHISQAYIPIGASYRFTSGSWTFTPNAEIDAMFWGSVSSHLQAIGGAQNADNTQHRGWGLRGEFMAGQQYEYFGWEAGPFVRYWRIPDSDCVVTPDAPPGQCFVEPENTRLQTGLAFHVKF